MKFSLLGCGIVLGLVLAGCKRDSYEVEIRPEGEAFQRQLTCWHVNDEGRSPEIEPLDSEQLARLSHLYPKRESPSDAKKQVFSGRFTGNTPADIDGAGSYTHFTSPLGSTSCYVERFRGDDDLASELAKRNEAADNLADLARGWLTAELGHDPNFPLLKTFLDVDLRRDLKNLGVYAWTCQATDDFAGKAGAELFVRAGQYFVERGYLSPQQIPLLLRGLTDRNPNAVLAHVQRFLARKMDVSDDRPLPASLGFLSDLPKVEASLDKYVRSTELFQKRLAAFKSQKKGRSDAKEPTPEEFVGELLRDVAVVAFGGLLGSREDSLDLKLHCDRKPYASNGKWDEKGATVSWSNTLGPRALPVECFALWSTPDQPFQEQHFGKVLLTGEPLARYVIWYRGLKPDEAHEWDQFLGRLKPGPEEKAAVAGFRFTGDAKPDPAKPKEKPASLADTPRQLILGAMKEATAPGR